MNTSREPLKRQVERILDFPDGATQQIIVKYGQPDPGLDGFARTVAETLNKRTLSTSPRDTLPVSNKVLKAAAKAERRRPASALDAKETSLSAQVAAKTPQAAVKIQSLRSHNLGAMRALLKLDPFKSVGLAADGQNDGGTAMARPFWTSSSFMIEMSRDDIWRIVNDDDTAAQIRGIFPNRRIALPPVVEPKHIPDRVKDNKVSAWGIRAIGALGAWGAFDARGAGVTIGLLDTGVDSTHPDLANKITSWAEFDDRGDEVVGSKPWDSGEHGTHVAGTMVGGNASGRWIGVAPKAQIAAALVINGKKGGSDAQVLAGIDWAIEQNVDVINMSLGSTVWGPDVPSTYTSAILNALRVGIPVVTAIGNEGSQTTGSPGNDYLAFAVGATDYRDRVAGFSGGRTQIIRDLSFFDADVLPVVFSKPDLSAPGVAVYSSTPNGQYAYFNGTSMAAPHVSAAIALLLSATNLHKVSATERAFVIQDLLTGSADELGEAGQDHRFGFGRLDILRAIGFAKDLGY